LSYKRLENKLQEVRKKRESEGLIMDEKNKACYTPEEVRMLVFAGQVSLTTVRQAVHTGQIPSIRLGEGTRTKILIPGSYVRGMQGKGYCQGNDND
jgi:hypothetical protein